MNNDSDMVYPRQIRSWLALAILLSAFLPGCSPSYSVYQFDNGDDYFVEGMQRIADCEGKMGFRDEMGRVVIAPRFAFAFPFRNGLARVTDSGRLVAVPGGEHTQWESEHWYFVDKNGRRQSP